MAPIKTISPDGSRKKGRIPAPSLPGFLKTSAERVTLVYEGGTRNVKKKQWLEETTVPVYLGWWWFADWNKTSPRACHQLTQFQHLDIWRTVFPVMPPADDQVALIRVVTVPFELEALSQCFLRRMLFI